MRQECAKCKCAVFDVWSSRKAIYVRCVKCHKHVLKVRTKKRESLKRFNPTIVTFKLVQRRVKKRTYQKSIPKHTERYVLTAYGFRKRRVKK